MSCAKFLATVKGSQSKVLAQERAEFVIFSSEITFDPTAEYSTKAKKPAFIQALAQAHAEHENPGTLVCMFRLLQAICCVTRDASA